MDRRKFATGLSVGTVTAIAGCSEFNSDPEPEPVLIDVDQQGRDTFFVIVQNEGSDGNLLVTLSFLDRNETVLGRVSRTVFINSEERRRVRFNRLPPEGTQTFEGAAELA